MTSIEHLTGEGSYLIQSVKREQPVEASAYRGAGGIKPIVVSLGRPWDCEHNGWSPWWQAASDPFLYWRVCRECNRREECSVSPTQQFQDEQDTKAVVPTASIGTGDEKEMK